MGKNNNNRLDHRSEFQSTLKALKECETLISYAQSQGYSVPLEVYTKMNELKSKKAQLEDVSSRNPNAVIDPSELSSSDIGAIHQALAKVIAPASPASVLLIEDYKKRGILTIFGQVPLIRRLNIITLMCLVTFFALFFSPMVNTTTINGDIFTYEPIPFVLNEMVIVVMAALGAAFYALFEVHKYISSKSYDPKYDSIYWIRFVLGIVSGVILAQFIFLTPEAMGQDPNATIDGISNSKELGGYLSNKPLLSFLGGFSARVVHKILNSLVESIETFISGSARDMVRAREAAAKVQMEEQVNAIQQKNATNNAVDRMKATMKVMELQQQLNNGASSEHVKTQLNSLMNELMQPVSKEQFNFNDNNYPKESFNTAPVNEFSTVQGDFQQQNFNQQQSFNQQQNFNQQFDHQQGNDVDTIDVPEYPDHLDNPDIPMPGDFNDLPKNDQ